MSAPIFASRADKEYRSMTSKHGRELLTMAQSLGKFCIGMEGNVSARNTNKAFYIKASGAKLASMKESDISEYAMDGVKIDGRLGSIETEFHRAIYAKFPEVNFIAHTHPVNTLKILCTEFAETFAYKRLYPEQVVFNGPESCLVPYETPGMALAEKVRIHINRFSLLSETYPKLILLKNHGIIACGKTIDECVAITETCEKAAEVFIGAMSTSGRVDVLTKEAIKLIVNDQQEKYRQGLV